MDKLERPRAGLPESDFTEESFLSLLNQGRIIVRDSKGTILKGLDGNTVMCMNIDGPLTMTLGQAVDFLNTYGVDEEG